MYPVRKFSGSRISKHSLMALAVFMICFFFVPAAFAGQGVISGSVVNVRSGPGTDYEITGNLYQDTQVDILESSGSWSKIKYASLQGWVASDYIDAAAASSATGSRQIQVVNGPINARSGPGTSFEIVDKIADQAIYKVKGESDGWYRIQLADGRTAYVAGWLVQEIGSNGTGSAAASSAAGGRQIQVVNGPINTRSGPGTSFEIVDKIADQAIYKVQGESDGWYKIQLADGRTAYVAGWLVQEIGSSSTSSTQAPEQTGTAGSTQTTSTAAQTGSTAPAVILNQKTLSFEVAPRIENGRTLVPLRAIFEAMGAYVEWNESTRTVTARRGNVTVILPLGSTSPTVNGQVWQLEVPAQIVNDRTLAPLRFVGEAFGGQVDWNAQSRVINITMAELEQPAAVKVTASYVNLRQAPSTESEFVEKAVYGEIMQVLQSKGGWYQIKHGSVTAWVASWLVEAAAASEIPVTVPADSAEPTPEPSNEPENALHLSRTRDTEGIKVIISSDVEMEPKISQSSGGVVYTFVDRQLTGLYYFEEAVGTQTLKAKASSQGEDTIINIDFPTYLEYKLSVEEDGKKLVILIYNTLMGIESTAFGSVGDRFIIKTICPVTATGKMDGDKLEVSIPNLKLKKGASYSYSSDLVDSLKTAASKSGSDLLITFNTSELGKYCFAASGNNEDLNIILIKKIVSQPREALVVLDAGHGGSDTGARGSLIDEKVVDLDVTMKVGNLLQQKGIRVEYTRTDDSYVGLEARSTIANKLNAALFVSIHSNSVANSAANGTETFFYAPLTNPDLFVQRDERYQIASLLQNELVKKLQRSNRGVKEYNYSVLRNTKMPSALVEIAFLSNPDEQALLIQDQFRSQAAQAIADGIAQYMSANQ